MCKMVSICSGTNTIRTEPSGLYKGMVLLRDGLIRHAYCSGLYREVVLLRVV